MNGEVRDVRVNIPEETIHHPRVGSSGSLAQTVTRTSSVVNHPQQDALGEPEIEDTIDNDSLHAERIHQRAKQGSKSQANTTVHGSTYAHLLLTSYCSLYSLVF